MKMKESKFIFHHGLEEVIERMRPLVDQPAGSGQLRLPTPSSVLEMYILPTFATVRAIFKGSALREQCVVETICTGYVTESNYSLYINF